LQALRSLALACFSLSPRTGDISADHPARAADLVLILGIPNRLGGTYFRYPAAQSACSQELQIPLISEGAD
jgi:hypothetical protein